MTITKLVTTIAIVACGSLNSNLNINVLKVDAFNNYHQSSSAYSFSHIGTGAGTSTRINTRISTRISTRTPISSTRQGQKLMYKNRFRKTFTFSTLSMSTSDDNGEEISSSAGSSSTSTSSTPRKRRKRKDGKNLKSIQNESTEEVAAAVDPVEDKKEETKIVEETANTPSPSPSTSSISSKPVQLQVMDVRDVVSGVAPKSAQVVQEDEYEEYDYEDEDDDDEYEYYYEDEDDNEVVVATGSKDSSLEDLLADAKRMRKEATESGEDENSFSIPSVIRSVISNIVTVDFFVVCALLAWFLAGIFCSYVIKDDTVQIAFNGIFEPVVQPALGVLMIGSAAGAVFNEEEKEE
jgi:hypothetical protein